MQFRTVICAGSIGLLGLGSAGVHGAVITPVVAFASSFYNSSLSPSQAINNAGLDTSSGDVLTYSHDTRGDGFGAWITGQGQGGGGSTAPATANQYIVFDLGANYDLTDAYIWQLVQGTLVDRGLKDFRLLGSSAAPVGSHVSNPPASYDLTGFTEILAPSVLAIGTLDNGQPVRPTAQTFSLTNADNIRQIYLDVNSAHSGATSSYVGLSEIKFEGMLAPPAPIVAQRWINPAGGSWQTGSNWSSSTVPTSGENVRFDLDSSYTVSTGSGTSIANLIVENGDVTLQVSGSALRTQTVTLDGGKLSIHSLMPGTGSAGQVAYSQGLTLNDGTLAINGGTLRAPSGGATIAGTTYSSVWLLSGEPASPARPTVELIDGGRNVGTTNAAGAGAIVIGASGGQGAVRVEGENSALQTAAVGNLAGRMVIGTGGISTNGAYYPGDGRLDVLAGGLARGGLDVQIGVNGGKGVVNVDGGNSRLISANTWLFVGLERDSTSGTGSDGTLTVTNGGYAYGTTIAIGYEGGTGRMTVSGAGSSAEALFGGLAIGYNNFGKNVPTSGHLTVADNANVSFTQHLLVGRGNEYATGTLDILNGGKVFNTTAVDYSAVGYHGNGTVHIDGAGSLLEYASQKLYIGFGSSGIATMTVTNGGTLRSANPLLIGAYGGEGELVVGRADGSDAEVARVTVGPLDVGTRVYHDGTLTVNPRGFVEVDGRVYSDIIGSHAINLLGGTIKADAYSLYSASVLNWTSGTLWLTGGNVNIGATNDLLTVPTAGILRGHGLVNRNLRVTGTITPEGSSGTGILSVRNLTIGTSQSPGTIAIDIDPASASADVLNVVGTVNLTNAYLNLALVGLNVDDLLTPQTFLLIQNDGIDPIVGTFSSVLHDYAGLVDFSIDYAFLGNAVNGIGTGNDVAITLTAVPEPATSALPLAVALGLLMRRRPARA